jgi:hypothetical protein
MKVCRFSYIIPLCFVLVTSCIESYPPPIINEEVNFLVIDGSVNSADGSAEVKLSRAIPLSSTEPAPSEGNANVQLEDNDGNVYSLPETSKGVYSQSNLPLDATKQYRLYVRTSTNTEYRSDFVSIKQTPPVDSVHWTPSYNPEGIEILINTHDDSKNTRYYQWIFEETYEYEAPFYSYLRYNRAADVVEEIPSDEMTFRCWRTLPSQKILIASSDKLSQDIIYNFPITFIPTGSQKTIIKYSILVKQRALSRQAYDYWLNLQKTTENLGSLFDPQPGQVTGNIHNVTDPSAPALGYFDVGVVQEKRLFVDGKTLPDELRSYKDLGFCRKDDTVFVAVEPFISSLKSSDEIVDALYGNGTVPYAYTFSSFECTDCRYQGGTTTKPPYWQ